MGPPTRYTLRHITTRTKDRICYGTKHLKKNCCLVSLVHLYFPMFTMHRLFVFSHASHRIGFTFITALTCHSSFESNGIKSIKQQHGVSRVISVS